jgi:hypothetical protein
MEGCHQPAATIGILQQRSAARGEVAAGQPPEALASWKVMSRPKMPCPGRLRLQVSRRCVRGAAQRVQ